MRRIIREVLMVLCVLALLFVLPLTFLSMSSSLRGAFRYMLQDWPIDRWYGSPFFYLVLIAALVGAFWALRREHLKAASLRDTPVGLIQASSEALESIVLNAAKASQSGVKTAKARIRNVQNERISVVLYVNVYSDVELPIMMARVQERVKKDLERYTGLVIEDVRVKVTRVEEIAARVER